VVAAHYKKDDLFNCWTSSSDISGYHADFHEGHGTVGAGQGVRHGMCELTNGMAGERHGRGMLCVSRPLGSVAWCKTEGCALETNCLLKHCPQTSLAKLDITNKCV